MKKQKPTVVAIKVKYTPDSDTCDSSILVREIHDAFLHNNKEVRKTARKRVRRMLESVKTLQLADIPSNLLK